MTIFSKTTVEDIRKSFLTTEITAITKRPTHPKLKPLVKGIKKCAESYSHWYLWQIYVTMTAFIWVVLGGAVQSYPSCPQAISLSTI